MKIYLCLAMTLLASGCGHSVSTAPTQANLDKVHDDMSSTEVRSILGDPAESQSGPIPIVGGMQTIYTYQNSSSGVTIIFKNDLVKAKHGTFSQ
jgi:hypothetical protein